MWSHERVKSKSVRGVAGASGASAGVDAARAGAGGTGDAGAGTSRDLNTVSLPDMRKMPPPTRPTDFTSRACFASLKDGGGSGGFCVVGAGAGAGAAGVDLASGGVDAEGDSVRELMRFRRSSSVRRGVLVDVEDGGWDCGVSSSTMVIGMRRRFGGAVDAAGRGVETWTGTDRCNDVKSDQGRRNARTKRGEGRGREEKARKGRTGLFPFFPRRMSSSTRASSVFTASLFGSSLSAL